MSSTQMMLFPEQPHPPPMSIQLSVISVSKGTPYCI